MSTSAVDSFAHCTESIWLAGRTMLMLPMTLPLPSKTGAAIPNATVNFTIDSQSCAATTNASGVASCSVVLNQTAGNYTMTASFGGIFGADAGTSNPVPFVITQEETTLSYTGDIVVANSRENLKLLLS